MARQKSFGWNGGLLSSRTGLGTQTAPARGNGCNSWWPWYPPGIEWLAHQAWKDFQRVYLDM